MNMKLEKKGLTPYKTKAYEYLRDKEKSLGLLNEALRKATTHRRNLGEVTAAIWSVQRLDKRQL